MKFWFGLGRTMTLAMLAALVVGCEPMSGSHSRLEDDPDFVRGKSRLARKDIDGAVLSFRKALANNPGNAAAHFELGLIFYEPSNKKNNYVSACYHLQRHLELQQDSRHAGNIGGFIKACKKEIAKDIAMAPIPPSEINAIHTLRTQLAKANSENSHLKSQVEAMRGRLQQAGSAVPEVAMAVAGPPPSVNPRNPRTTTRPTYSGRSGQTRTHMLKAGESLYSLSRRYGVPFSALKAANPRLMRNSRDLKPGVTVYIPAKRTP
jgi:LysM repeat protein